MPSNAKQTMRDYQSSSHLSKELGRNNRHNECRLDDHYSYSSSYRSPSPITSCHRRHPRPPPPSLSRELSKPMDGQLTGHRDSRARFRKNVNSVTYDSEEHAQEQEMSRKLEEVRPADNARPPDMREDMEELSSDEQKPHLDRQLNHNYTSDIERDFLYCLDKVDAICKRYFARHGIHV